MAEATDSPVGGQKMVPAACACVLLMALGCTGITKAQFEMSTLDSTRTASSFEHKFRSISAKAKKLRKRIDDGRKFLPVQPGQERGSTTISATSRERKGDDAYSNQEAEGHTQARSKKTQAQAQTEAAPIPQTADNDDDLPDVREDLIKNEKQ